MLTKQDIIAAKKQLIQRGTRLTSDCAVPGTFVKSAPTLTLDEIRARIDALQKKIEEAAAEVRRSRAQS